MQTHVGAHVAVSLSVTEYGDLGAQTVHFDT